MIKRILDEITAEGGDIKKKEILESYKETENLKRVLYMAKSPRVKYFIKKIPEYTPNTYSLGNNLSNAALSNALDKLSLLSDGIVRGNAAIEHLKEILENIDADNAYVIERIIDRDLKFGMGTSNINKIYPELIEKTPYMGAKPFTVELAKALFVDGKGVRSDIKMDGRYQNAIIQNGRVQLVTRQGEETPVGDAKFLKELTTFPDGVFNGELTIDGEPRRTVANGIVSSIVDIEGKRKKRTEKETEKKIANFTKKHGDYQSFINRIAYTVWDRIELDEYFKKGTKIKSTRPYWKRRTAMEALISHTHSHMVRVVESKIVYSYAEAVEHFLEALARGLEGTILKDVDCVWKDGKDDWQIKMKLEIHVDLRIIEFNYGNGKNANVISSLTCESEDGILITKPTGMDEYTMQLIEENQESLRNTIMECKSCGVSQNSKGGYSMFHPVFIKLRDDKSVADNFKEIMAIEEAAKLLA